MRVNMLLSAFKKVLSAASENEERAAEFKRQVAHYHLKPEVEADLILRARRRAVTTPFSFPDLLLNEIQQLRNKGFL